jgi:hypothetical protein
MCSFDGSVPKILTWEDYQKHFKQLKTNIKWTYKYKYQMTL